MGLGSAVGRHLMSPLFERWQGRSVWSPAPQFGFASPLQGASRAQGSTLTPARGKEMTPGDAASSPQLSEAAWPGKEGEDKEGDLGSWEQRKAARGLT